MFVDVVMLADSKSPELISMTQRAIDTLHSSETDHEFIAVVVESNKNVHLYNNANILTPNFEFNYHWYMKYGLQHLSEGGLSDFVCLANNDLIFHKNWFTEIVKASEDMPLVKSFSSFNPSSLWIHDNKYHIGYGVGGVVTGWCLTMKKEILDVIDLSEDVNFWCSDNVYNDELIKHGIQHALVRDSHVTHLGGATLFTLNSERISELTSGQVEIYHKRGK